MDNNGTDIFGWNALKIDEEEEEASTSKGMLRKRKLSDEEEDDRRMKQKAGFKLVKDPLMIVDEKGGAVKKAVSHKGRFFCKRR